MERLDLYRRHSAACPHREKGQNWTACDCPIWAYGHVDGQPPVRLSLRTRDWGRAGRRLEELAKDPDTIRPARSPRGSPNWKNICLSALTVSAASSNGKASLPLCAKRWSGRLSETSLHKRTTCWLVTAKKC
ncbi:MAG: hypothetical protein ABI972_25535 [Acidobacteriota bacterium]